MKRPVEEIRKDIQEHLLWDERLSGAAVAADVSENGEVRLTGEVSSRLIKQAAEQDVRVIPGTGVIHNELSVKSSPAGPPRSGENLAQALETLFAMYPEFASENISVAVDRQTVTLRGAVSAFWKKARAHEIVSDVEGADTVHNQLSVARSEQPLDREVAMRIQTAIKRSGVDPDRITIDVREGKVTLSGTVETWERYSAVHDAALYTRGIAAFENHVTVA